MTAFLQLFLADVT